MRYRFIGKPFYAPDADDQGGGDRERGSDILDRYNKDPIRMAEKLAEVLTDNHSLREKNRTLRQQVTEAQGKVPGEGTVILTADQAKELETYRSLGTLDVIKSAIEGRAPIEQELTALKREKQLSQAALAAGFKPSVLATLAGDLDIQTKADKDGKPVVVVITDGKETPLADYATKTWTDFLPALKTAESERKAPDINASTRGNGSTTPDDVNAANRQRLARRY